MSSASGRVRVVDVAGGGFSGAHIVPDSVSFPGDGSELYPATGTMWFDQGGFTTPGGGGGVLCQFTIPAALNNHYFRVGAGFRLSGGSAAVEAEMGIEIIGSGAAFDILVNNNFPAKISGGHNSRSFDVERQFGPLPSGTVITVGFWLTTTGYVSDTSSGDAQFGDTFDILDLGA